MLPIPSEFMGPEDGKIAVLFHNGTEVVTGYMVKQTGVHRYVVSDGIQNYTVLLARTPEVVQNLTFGWATILCYPFIDGAVSQTPEHIKTLERYLAYTVEGNHYSWKDGHAASRDGIDANIALVGDPT